jgi:hypothetical protein
MNNPNHTVRASWAVWCSGNVLDSYFERCWVWVSAGTATILTEVFRVLLQSLHADSRISTAIRLRSLPSGYLPVHHSSQHPTLCLLTSSDVPSRLSKRYISRLGYTSTERPDIRDWGFSWFSPVPPGNWGHSIRPRQLPSKSYPIHRWCYYLTLHSVEVLSGAVDAAAFCPRNSVQEFAAPNSPAVLSCPAECRVRLSLQQSPSDFPPRLHLSQRFCCRSLWAEAILTERFRVFFPYLQADA